MIIDEIFSKKSQDNIALENFGFKLTEGGYVYTTTLSEPNFVMTVRVSGDKVTTMIFDTEIEEEYNLHLSESAEGEFVGKIRTEHEKILREICEKCFVPSIVKSGQVGLIAKYAQKKYGEQLEFLWENDPNCAIIRHKDSKKWYALIMDVKLSVFGITTDKRVQIIDFRATPTEITNLVDNKKYFGGYHMNKKTWYSIILDGDVSARELYARLDHSRMLSSK